MSLSLAMLLAESARKYPQRTAAVLGDERVTYARLWDETLQFAAVLRDEHGVRAGDTVALLMPNVIEFPRAYYAVLALGAVVVPVHALLTPQEIEYVLRDSGAKLLISHPMLPAGAQGAQLAGVPVVTALRQAQGGSIPHHDNAVGVVQRDAGDDAVILYTSGTTGKPKGAVLTHLNMVMNATVCAFDLFEAREDDVMLCALPLFHSFGQTCVMNTAFRCGGTIVLLPRFDGKAALDLMVRENVTCFAGVPTMYVALLEAAKSDPRRPPLRRLNSGGAALPVAILERVEATFGVQVEEGYGLSETSPVATFNQRAIGVKPGTVGTPIWGVQVAIANPDVEDRIEQLPPGERGEIVIRGHCVFSRYLNNPQATAAAKVDGWFRSGDIGAMDDDGFVSILDRKKDMILRGGFNVYPREVEEVLRAGHSQRKRARRCRRRDRSLGEREHGQAQISAFGGVRRVVSARPKRQGAQTRVGRTLQACAGERRLTQRKAMYEPGRTLPPAMRKYLIDLRDELRKEPLAYRDAIKELRRRALNATARWQRARHGPHEQQRWDDLRAATAAYDRARGARTSYEGAVWRIDDLLRCASSRAGAQCTGYVYLFRPAPELDVVKIGWTNNPERRLRNLRAAWNKALPAIHLEKWAPCTAADFTAWCPAEPDDEWRIQSMFREFSLPYVKNESRGHDWFAYNPEMQRLFELNLRLRDGEPAHRLVHLVEFLLWDGLLGDQSALRRAQSALLPEHSMKDVIASCVASASGTAE